MSSYVKIIVIVVSIDVRISHFMWRFMVLNSSLVISLWQ